MRPVLSTRLFGDLPTSVDLELARSEGFLDLELWTDPLTRRSAAEVDRFLSELDARGFRVPCVHAPTVWRGRPLALEGGEMGLDPLRWAMDVAQEARARIVVVHLGGHSRQLPDLASEATERGVLLALEIGAVENSGIQALHHLLDSLGPSPHGLCADLSHQSFDAPRLRELGTRLLWLEVSARRGGREHVLPDPELRRILRGVPNLPYFAFEIVLPGSEIASPGAAEVALTLRRLRAWTHAGDVAFTDGYPGRGM